MPMIPYKELDERILSVDSAGSGLVMSSEKVLGKFRTAVTLVAGSLTRAQRIARTDLLSVEGAKIKESDTGFTLEVKGGVWARATSDLVQSVVAGAGQVSRPVRCATFGPSHADLNPALTDISKFVGVMGTSTPSISPERWQVNSFYPMAYLVANGGIGGETTSTAVGGMLYRSTVAYSTSRRAIQDVLDARPDVVFLCGLDTNDFAGLTSGNYAATVATTLANHRTIVQAFLTAGVLVVEEGNYPYSATAHTNPGLTRQAILETNAAYAADVAAYQASGIRNIEFVDACGFLGDSSANYLPNMSQNDAFSGLHKSFYGEWVLSQQRAAVLTKNFGYSSPRRYNGPNILKDATNTSGNNSLGLNFVAGVGGGPRPVGWTQGAANLTQNLASLEIINGKRFFMMKGTGTGASNALNCYFPIDNANFAPAAGDIFGLEFDLYVSDANGGPPPILKTTTSRFNMTNTVPQTMNCVHFQNASALQARAFPSAYMAHVVFQPYQMPAVGTLTGGGTVLQIFNEWITDEQVQWKHGIAEPRLVKLGSGGVIDPWHQ